jgi:transcriptional regulator with XRE-family HTH domain
MGAREERLTGSGSRIAVKDEPDSGAGGESYVPAVGSLIRGLRKQHGLSLKDVASASGLSVSFLSAVERGRSDISVQRLARIAAVFNHDLGSLLGYGARRSIPQPIEATNRMTVDRGDGIDYEVIRIPGTGMELFVSTLAPESRFESSLTHPGFDIAYIVEGEIVLEFNGADYAFAEGDCVMWPGSYSHLVRNDASKPARLVAITTETVY